LAAVFCTGNLMVSWSKIQFGGGQLPRIVISMLLYA
jgi:hypothetical protein